jgi:hypothetical protein
VKLEYSVGPRLALLALALVLALDLLVIGGVGFLMYRAGDSISVREFDGLECLSASRPWGDALYIAIRCVRAGE